MDPQDWVVLIFKLSGLALVFLGFYIELTGWPYAWVFAALSVLVGLAILRGE